MMKIGAIMLARSGSSFKDKNIKEVFGLPLMAYGMLAAKATNLIDCFYLSSDSNTYLKIGEDYGFKSILRPNSLSKSDSKSDDAVLHAYNSSPELKNCEIIIVQHANVITIYPEIMEKAINLLIEKKEITSVVPAHINNEYNPLRSFYLRSKDRTLSPFLKYDSSVSPNRQDLPNAYFLDHSFWCIRANNLIEEFGFCPWNSLGNKIYPLETEGMFDIHNEIDIQNSKNWLLQNREKLKYLKCI